MPRAKKVVAKKVAAKKTPSIKKGKKQTYVALVIDKSGSMLDVRCAAISAINEQIAIIKKNVKLTGDTFVSFIQFNNDIVVKFDKQNAKDLTPITEQDYIPEGSTAMYDALGEAIRCLQKDVVETDDTAYLVVLVSDGYENASKKENQISIANKTNELQKTGKWTFTAMLSNVDVTAVSMALHIPAGNAMSFASTTKGVQRAGSIMSASYSLYSTVRESGVLSSIDMYSGTPDLTITTNKKVK